MSAKIARGSSTRGKTRSRPIARGPARKAPQPGMLDSLSLPAETVRRVSGWIMLALLLALAVALAVAFRLPQMAGFTIGEQIGRAGFTVRRIESKGLNRMNPMTVYKVAEDQLDKPMPLVDLAGTRERLLRFGWVGDARVYRRFPDTLVVDVVERTPSAIWQHNQHLTLVDHDGTILEPVRLDAMPDLPLVIGPEANRHLTDLKQLMDSAPSLKPLVAGATWVGGRRWDIRFQTGEVLALPEGDTRAIEAFRKFADTDHKQPLLGGRFVHFDMRIPGKIYVRLHLEPGATVPAINDAAPPKPSDAVPTPATTTRDTI